MEGPTHTGRRAIVIGAGPGGLCAAVALRRAGFDVAVFESASDLSNVQLGGGIHLWNNALLALRELGLYERVLTAGVEVERFEWRTSGGTLLGSGDVASLTRALDAPALGFTRTDLHAALLEGLESVALETGASCTGFREDPSGVVATFADGREERADILIGADGVHSVVRRQLLGEGEVRYSGVVNLQAVIHEPDITPRGTYGMFWGCGTRVGFYPVRGGTFWYALIRAPAGGPTAPRGLKAALLDLVGDWVEPTRTLIDGTPEEAIVRSDLGGRDPVDRWGAGRVTLLGDAAHAMTPFMGQGAGQALEDAAVLQRTLSKHDDLPTALREYEGRRRPRTAEITKRSWRVGQGTKMKNPVACGVRNRIVRRIYPRVIWPQFAKQISGEFLGD